MLHDGVGTEKDYDQAAYWCRYAAERENAAGQSCLAILYAQGHGVEKDYVESHMWATLALAKLPEGDARKIAIRGLKMLDRWGMSKAEVKEAKTRAANWHQPNLSNPKAFRNSCRPDFVIWLAST